MIRQRNPWNEEPRKRVNQVLLGPIDPSGRKAARRAQSKLNQLDEVVPEPQEPGPVDPGYLPPSPPAPFPQTTVLPFNSPVHNEQPMLLTSTDFSYSDTLELVTFLGKNSGTVGSDQEYFYVADLLGNVARGAKHLFNGGSISLRATHFQGPDGALGYSNNPARLVEKLTDNGDEWVVSSSPIDTNSNTVALRTGTLTNAQFNNRTVFNDQYALLTIEGKYSETVFDSRTIWRPKGADGFSEAPDGLQPVDVPSKRWAVLAASNDYVYAINQDQPTTTTSRFFVRNTSDVTSPWTQVASRTGHPSAFNKGRYRVLDGGDLAMPVLVSGSNFTYLRMTPTGTITTTTVPVPTDISADSGKSATLTKSGFLFCTGSKSGSPNVTVYLRSGSAWVELGSIPRSVSGSQPCESEEHDFSNIKRVWVIVGRSGLFSHDLPL